MRGNHGGIWIAMKSIIASGCETAMDSETKREVAEELFLRAVRQRTLGLLDYSIDVERVEAL